MPPKQSILKGLTKAELRSFAESIGESPYRGDQLFSWMYARTARTFKEMTDLSEPLRDLLSTTATLECLRLESRTTSPTDGTTKFLFRLQDNALIETVLIPSERESEDDSPRLTLCVSTQVGCPLDCKFCATGTMGFSRNLTVGEIVDQVVTVQNLSGQRITNLVYMGMGEPMLNYENVLKSVEILTDDHALNIGWRHITISTAGYADHIRKLADDPRKVKLALSLHSLVDEVRTRLMPINKKYPVEQVLEAVSYYYRTTGRRPTFEYILFEGVNDSPDDLKRLVALSRRIPSKINLIPYHSIEFALPSPVAGELRPVSRRRMEDFAQQLREAQCTVMVRSSSGEDIAAACGQLAVVRSQSNVRKDALPVS